MNSPVGLYRTIFAGWPSDPADPYYEQTPPAGELSHGPVGLGYLLLSGYIGDARTFYCPSSGGDMPSDGARCYWGHDVAEDIGFGGRSPADWQRAGGFDRETALLGDWKWFGNQHWRNRWIAGTYGGFMGHVIQSDYNYRNVPISSWTAPLSEEDPPQPVIDRVYLPWTRPMVRADMACPTFKTQKLLAGRAIVSDSFSQHEYIPGFPPAHWPTDVPEVGKGFYAHRSGYNVLYGDWSAKWYGDDNEDIMWKPPYGGTTHLRRKAMVSLEVNNTFINYISGDGVWNGETWIAGQSNWTGDSWTVWHTLDVAHGTDRD